MVCHEIQKTDERWKIMKAWEDLLSSLEAPLGRDAIVQWLRPIKVLRFDAANLYLEATPFQKAWFDEHAKALVGKSFANNNQRPIRIHWEESKNAKESNAAPSAWVLSDPLEADYRFDSFLPSASNLMAYRMAEDLLRTLSSNFNPIVFSGPSGCGKTHLLMAIAHGAQLKGRKVFYVKANTFTEHVVQSIRRGSMQDFRQAYRNLDMLIVDDIHTFARKNTTQEEFFHTFNALHTAGLQIVLGSREAPGQLKDIESRLISRFEWGISIPMDAPDSSLLLQILELKAKTLHLEASPDLLFFLADRFKSCSKAPIQALHALALRSPKNLHPTHAEKVLSDLLAEQKSLLISPEKIIEQTSFYFGIRTEDLLGRSQTREFAQPRKLAMFLCRTALEMPFQAIGRLFERDHSTVMTSVRQIETASADANSLTAKALNEILKKIQKPSHPIH